MIDVSVGGVDGGEGLGEGKDRVVSSRLRRMCIISAGGWRAGPLRRG
jgi:hypothetical protein